MLLYRISCLFKPQKLIMQSKLSFYVACFPNQTVKIELTERVRERDVR
jgi:hypothetical protein